MTCPVKQYINFLNVCVTRLKKKTKRNYKKRVFVYLNEKNFSKFAIFQASSPPFLLELFLWANIIEEESTCTLDEDKVIFSLRKANVSLKWPKLELDDLDKDTKRNYRNRAIERIQKVTEERRKAQSGQFNRRYKHFISMNEYLRSNKNQFYFIYFSVCFFFFQRNDNI